MARFGMAIDLDKCVGCGACAIACKTENNTEHQRGGQKFNWADFLVSTEGKFVQGNLKFKVIPVLCNHCSDAPCVEACPVTPKAMYKTDSGITMHNDDLCIGCQMCQIKCPYSNIKITSTKQQYSVISYNSCDHNSHIFWDDDTEIIANGTSSPAETAELADFVPPYMNEYTHTDYHPVRPPNVTEKCIFCDHRLQNGDLPYCVVSCPAGARNFGDLDDPQSDISKTVANGYARLKNNDGEFLDLNDPGTKPNVYYIGGSLPLAVNEKEEPGRNAELIRVFPNPISSNGTIEFNLVEKSIVDISIYSVSGKMTRSIVHGKEMLKGNHEIKFDVSGLSSGTYIIVLSHQNNRLSTNLVVH